MKIINSTLSTIRNQYWIAVISLVLCVATNAMWAVYCLSVALTHEAKVYVPTLTGTIIAEAQDPDHRSLHEVRYHARLFVTKLMAWDTHTYTKNMNEAFALIDKEDGLKVFSNIENMNVYQRAKAVNGRSYVDIKHIEVDMSEEPYKVSMIAVTALHHEDQIDYLKFKAAFTLTKVPRSENNPCGLLIRDWEQIKLQKESRTVGK